MSGTKVAMSGAPRLMTRGKKSKSNVRRNTPTQMKRDLHPPEMNPYTTLNATTPPVSLSPSITKMRAPQRNVTGAIALNLPQESAR